VAKKVLIVLFAFSVLFLGFSVGRFTSIIPTSKMSYAAKQNKQFKELDEMNQALALAIAASSPTIAEEMVKNLKKQENLPREAFTTLVALAKGVQGSGKGKQGQRPQRTAPSNDPKDVFKQEKVTLDVPQGSYSVGNKNAPVQIVTFTEFLCPYCARLDPSIRQLQEEFGADKVHVTFQSRIVHGERAEFYHRAAAAAGLQGKFFEFVDALFSTQKDWIRTPPEKAFDEVIAPKAKALGLDVAKLKKDMDGDKVKAQVGAEDALGQKLGVRGTPTSFVNGYMVRGAKPKEFFKGVIEMALEKK